MMKTLLVPVVLAVSLLSLAAGSFVFVGEAPTPAVAAAPEKSDKPVKRSGKPIDITYDDLKTEITKDTKWNPSFVTPRIKELDGKTVRLRGFMLAGFQTQGIEQFVMLKNTECKFGEGGEAHHCIMVHMTPGESTRFTVRVLEVEGVLLLKPWEGPDGNTWALYELRDAVVK